MEELPLQTYKEQTLVEILADPPVLITDLRWSTTSHEMVRISAQSGRLIFDPEGSIYPSTGKRYGTLAEILLDLPIEHNDIAFSTDTYETIKISEDSDRLIFTSEGDLITRYGTLSEIMLDLPNEIGDIRFATDTKEIIKISKYSGEIVFIKESEYNSTASVYDLDATTEGQTDFTDISYIAGRIDVFVQGVKLRITDFTADNGTDVILHSGVSVGTWVQIVNT